MLITGLSAGMLLLPVRSVGVTACLAAGLIGLGYWLTRRQGQRYEAHLAEQAGQQQVNVHEASEARARPYVQVQESLAALHAQVAPIWLRHIETACGST